MLKGHPEALRRLGIIYSLCHSSTVFCSVPTLLLHSLINEWFSSRKPLVVTSSARAVVLFRERSPTCFTR